MTQERKDKQAAAVISAVIHVAVFGFLAAGGMFTFLQSHSQAVPIDVTVYNEDADRRAADNGTASHGDGSGFYHAGEAMPPISEAYTDQVQAEREIKETMKREGLSEDQAKDVVAARKAAAGQGASEANGAAGTGEAGTESQGDGFGGQGGTGSTGIRLATKARLISIPDVSSLYPRELRRKNITGTVTVHVVIDETGSVTSASVVGSSGYEAMDSAALSIAYQCQYEAAQNEYGQPVMAERNLTIPFQLQ